MRKQQISSCQSSFELKLLEYAMEYELSKVNKRVVEQARKKALKGKVS